jgi:tetratricopeptide (TPR) repeat protein
MDAKEYCQRGWDCSGNSDHDQAIVNFTEAISLDNNNAEAYAGRSWSYSRNQEHERAVADAEMAVSLNPAERDYRKNLRRIKARAGIGFSVIGAIIGIFIGTAIGGFMSSGDGGIIAGIAIAAGAVIGGIRRVRRILSGIFRFFKDR